MGGRNSGSGTRHLHVAGAIMMQVVTKADGPAGIDMVKNIGARLEGEGGTASGSTITDKRYLYYHFELGLTAKE